MNLTTNIIRFTVGTSVGAVALNGPRECSPLRTPDA